MQTQFQAKTQVQYVGVGRRFVATLVDLILFLIVFVVVAVVSGNAQASGGSASASLTGTPALILDILFFLYYIVLEAVLGATLGKLLLRLRVVNVDGSRIGWGASIIRNLLRIIDVLPFFYLLGAILIWTSPQPQRLSDRVPKTPLLHP